MTIHENVSLKPHNTFGVDSTARYLVELFDIDELSDIITFSKEKKLPILFLGGGSNILFTDDVEMIVVKVMNKGIEVVYEDDEIIEIEVAAGEIWDELVEYTVKNGWGGIENLSLIPGTVGAAPIQNIGAYGVELKDVIVSVNAIMTDSFVNKVFEIDECEFGYRTSVFKNKLKNKIFIYSVNLKLSKKPTIKIEYGTIKFELEKKQIANPTIFDLREIIIRIRESKLPNPIEIGNAGSFFKNPVIPKEELVKVESKFPDIPTFNVDDYFVKIPAGWLIEKSGLKGYRKKEVGIHNEQALVIVNYGNATGKEIISFKDFVKEKVYSIFGIHLEEEVNII